MTRAGPADSDVALEPISANAFKSEVRSWAERIGVQPAEVHIRQMKRKWASCSSRGRLTFDAELLSQPAAFRNEVVVHELLHLKVPNHGKLFHTLLRAYVQEGEVTLNPPALVPA